MIMPVLLDEVKTATDKGDLFESRVLLVLALLVVMFLIGYMLIIIAKRLMVVITALSAPSKLTMAKPTARDAKASNPDPWAESSKRMSPVVFMPGSTPPENPPKEDPDAPKEGPGETDGEGWKNGQDGPKDDDGPGR